MHEVTWQTSGRKIIVEAIKARTIDPVLASLKDNVLYLEHNLNARAIASLKGELSTVNEDVNTLIEAMQTAINESSAFIEQMKTND